VQIESAHGPGRVEDAAVVVELEAPVVRRHRLGPATSGTAMRRR
jgi:hypothetical protein